MDIIIYRDKFLQMSREFISIDPRIYIKNYLKIKHVNNLQTHSV